MSEKNWHGLQFWPPFGSYYAHPAAWPGLQRSGGNAYRIGWPTRGREIFISDPVNQVPLYAHFKYYTFCFNQLLDMFHFIKNVKKRVYLMCIVVGMYVLRKLLFSL